jgi:hypothetical protein
MIYVVRITGKTEGISPLLIGKGVSLFVEQYAYFVCADMYL